MRESGNEPRLWSPKKANHKGRFIGGHSNSFPTYRTSQKTKRTGSLHRFVTLPANNSIWVCPLFRGPPSHCVCVCVSFWCPSNHPPNMGYPQKKDEPPISMRLNSWRRALSAITTAPGRKSPEPADQFDHVAGVVKNRLTPKMGCPGNEAKS